MTDLLMKEEVYAVVGAAMAVYNELRPGFLEGVYHEALEIELQMRHIPFQSHVPLTVSYKGRTLDKRYEADIVAYDRLVIELKAMKKITGVERSQLLNYLKATGYRVGLLLNFGSHEELEWMRMVR